MIILLLIICLMSVWRYKESVLICASTLLFLPNLSSGISDIKLLYVVCLVQIFLFYLKGKWRIKGNKYPPVLLLLSIFTSFCYFYSTYRGVMRSEWAVSVVNAVCYFYYPYIVWELIRDEKDIRFILKSFIFFFSIVGVYAIIELLIGENIYSVLANEYNIVSGILGGEENVERFGLRRCNSILPYSSTLGMTSAVMFLIVMYLKINKILILERTQWLLLFLMPFCVLLSGTRSQFIVALICVFPFLWSNTFFKSRISKVFIFITLIGIFFFSDWVLMIIDSVINSNQANMGSSADMRKDQFDICYFYYSQNPIWGWGKNYIWDYVRPYNPALYGAESVWFQLMVDYGILGCITYLLICVYSAYWVGKFSKIFFFFPLAFLVGKTLSIVIGIEISFLLIICIVLIKTKTLLIDPIR